MRCLLLCLGPALCERGVRKHCFFFKSQLCGGLVPVAACFLWLPRASLVSSSLSCLLCGGELLGLGEGHQARKSTEISHTSWRIFKLSFVYNVLALFGSTTISPPGQPGAPPQGFSETHRLFPPALTGTPTVGLEPTTTRLRALRSAD